MPSPVKTALAFLRNTWRGLTSMRTALVLLFLLALAALPGALIPQRSLNQREVDKYFAEYPTLAPWLDEVGAFEVFSSVWFASIYVLLFISLIGCLLPRCLEYYKQLRGRPVRTPRNLARMPHHDKSTVDASVDEVMTAARKRLRGWRTEEREEEDGSRSISAERGYLREAGNLVFHFALVGLLVGVAGGKLYGYEGQVIVMADGSEFCNSGTYNYDSFRAGLTVDGTKLSPFCVRVNDFGVEYLHTGQAQSYKANLEYQSGEDLETGTWKPYLLEVNHPLRTAGDRVYLSGNGYAPQFTVTFPGGEKRTGLVQWQPVDVTTMLSQGATKFDPPGVTDEAQRRQNQLAVTGLFAPTASFDGALVTSRFPDKLDPVAAVDVMRGDLGLDSGRGQSIFGVDQSMVEQGRLNRVARQNLRPGEELRLDDGTTVHFDGVQRWVNLQISHDPFQPWVLGFAIAVIFGIGASLSIKRRRIWVRVHPQGGDGDGGRSVVEVGGLARTDQAGYGEEFTRLAADLLATDGERSPESRTRAESVREKEH
ncbi:cytochrome c biogenesis protein [Saccharopolyspora erythraea NRRL 2338]|uniref:Possible cytochrome c biogenesis membrane protein n=2 Tax=Saccharopolyspora erythraea TaxID=1836 RepID=A4FPW9_SACEN|nr:cytochrome c biogenesis protein ResB [Saccharopolyspora erythraea]EQD84538.1 cytochrome C biogenesis protein ResB [Saccharopolyspora erythraea D]PFG99739.1 cytochrome c biogenesis protein [Saccharopolyspora erythraea NRRL 2338]QRK89617.1 cytochrome c biogenesis protein ResB [Saccharopolyspora erythraea]CAM06094.1 possible cytochrome c biogenesis membrane protein [Saccharopolyspora erythraea NRRL 2338]